MGMSKVIIGILSVGVLYAEYPKVKMDVMGNLIEFKTSETEKINYSYDQAGNMTTVSVTTSTGSLTQVDSDGDKIPDAWEVKYTGNRGNVDATSDFDGDGDLDLMEYATGHRPDLPGSRSTPTPSGVGVESNGRRFFIVEFQRRIDSGIELDLVTSTSLEAGSWNDNATIIPQGTVNNGNGTETVTCKCYPPEESGEKFFVRLEVE